MSGLPDCVALEQFEREEELSERLANWEEYDEA